jgi:hypothetical protein
MFTTRNPSPELHLAIARAFWRKQQRQEKRIQTLGVKENRRVQHWQ